jgi:predicted nucleotidyltransferase
MKRLHIDWLAFEVEFDDNPDEFGTERANYFDLESGKVVVVDEYVLSTVNSIIYELDEILEEGTDWTEDIIRGTDVFRQLPEAEQSNVRAAIEIEYDDSKRYEKIPSRDSREAYKEMQDFIETIDDEVTRARLSEAITRNRPFRRVRDEMASDRRLEQQWRVFEADRQRKAIIEWLRTIGVEPTNPEDTTYEPPPLPELRKIMFAEVRRFVRFACHVEGVRQIALIGSLATDKEFPKDVDVLVTVSDSCDLSPLAKLGRELSGHMNNHRAGADVFLASEDGNYIGRTCPWKNCGPGYRASCDAMNCGKRPYLHDDLDAVHLDKAWIDRPPVVLWPVLTAAQGVPSDVHEQLIEPLANDEKR